MGRDGEAGLGESNTYSQSHNNQISRAWLQEEMGQRKGDPAQTLSERTWGKAEGFPQISGQG